MSDHVKIEDMSAAILDALGKYDEDVGEDIVAVVDQIAKETVADLRRTSPRLTGDYQKGWSKAVLTKRKGRYVQVVRNKTNYQLTHLLEFGHAKRNGGRVSAKPHIRQAEAKAKERLEQGIMEVLG